MHILGLVLKLKLYKFFFFFLIFEKFIYDHCITIMLLLPFQILPCFTSHSPIHDLLSVITIIYTHIKLKRMFHYSLYEYVILLALFSRTIFYPLYILAHIKKSIDCEYKLISRIFSSIPLVHAFALLIQIVYHLDYYNFVAHFHVCYSYF